MTLTDTDVLMVNRLPEENPPDLLGALGSQVTCCSCEALRRCLAAWPLDCVGEVAVWSPAAMAATINAAARARTMLPLSLTSLH
jgi:hypothetical protein